MPSQLQAPRSQHDRNITIRVSGGGVDGYVSFTFPIKPKELQRDTPVRMSTTQTLAGVYQDIGGPGITTLTYSGHTGWRRLGPQGTQDGWDVFRALYHQIFLEYHHRIKMTSDPESVICIVIDDLYETVYRVSLDDFQATKSASSPLLYNYTLKMTVKFTSYDARDPEEYNGLSLVLNYGSNSGKNVAATQASNAIQTANQYAPPATRTYKVQSGDSLWTIAEQFYQDGTKDIKIAQANGIKAPLYTIYPGQVLQIPN